MKKTTLALALLSLSLGGYAAEKSYPQSEPIASIPLPPVGMRWVLNEEFSDEFNDTELDRTKWLDYHDAWIGRTPGLFEPKQVSMRDGYLVLKGEKMERDTLVHAYNQDLTYNISCAAVVSKTQKAHYGYYECRFKANKTTLSTTFWLSSRGGKGNFSTEGRQPEGATKGVFSQELDICETIGRSGDFDGKKFYEGMNSNVHYWFSPEGGGAKKDIRIRETKLLNPDGSKPSEGFNTYGCWWQDAENATFYLNNEVKEERHFVGREKWGEPYDNYFRFTEPMGINLVVETYPYPWIALPTDEELADDSRNQSYYDWVRSYVLVNAITPVEEAAPTVMFEEHIHFHAKPQQLAAKEGYLDFSLTYTANENRTLHLVIYNEKGEVVRTKKQPAYGGYAHLVCSLRAPEKGEKFHAVAYLTPVGKTDMKDAFEVDSFAFRMNR